MVTIKLMFDDLIEYAKVIIKLKEAFGDDIDTSRADPIPSEGGGWHCYFPVEVSEQ